MKILIVDDEQSLLESLTINLTAFGHQVASANTGYKALELLKSSIKQGDDINLLVTDLKMPKMDGMELLRSVRSLVPLLPAILMTAYDDGSVQKELTLLGGCRYIKKPFGPDELIQTISKVFAEINASKIKETPYEFNRDQIQ